MEADLLKTFRRVSSTMYDQRNRQKPIFFVNLVRAVVWFYCLGHNCNKPNKTFYYSGHSEQRKTLLFCNIYLKSVCLHPPWFAKTIFLLWFKITRLFTPLDISRSCVVIWKWLSIRVLLQKLIQIILSTSGDCYRDSYLAVWERFISLQSSLRCCQKNGTVSQRV